MKSTQLCALSGAFGALFATAGGACSEFAMLAVAETHHDLVKTVVEVSCTEEQTLFDRHGDGSSFIVFAPLPVDVTGKDIVQAAIGKWPFYTAQEDASYHISDLDWTLVNQWLVIDDQGTDYVYCGTIQDGKEELYPPYMITIIR